MQETWHYYMPLSSLYTKWQHKKTWWNKVSTFWPDANLVGDINAQYKIQWGCISFGIVCGNDMVDFIIWTTAYALLSWEQYVILPNCACSMLAWHSSDLFVRTRSLFVFTSSTCAMISYFASAFKPNTGDHNFCLHLLLYLVIT